MHSLAFQILRRLIPRKRRLKTTSAITGMEKCVKPWLDWRSDAKNCPVSIGDIDRQLKLPATFRNGLDLDCQDIASILEMQT